jgi:N-acyl-D-aspartate/D-glutamate deacylase
MGPGRREAVAAWADAPGLARMTLRRRNNVEGVFSVLAGPCGLSALPSHVRRLDRVTRHVGAKIILYHARLLAQERAAAA